MIHRLIEAFQQTPPLPTIHGTCASDYNGDPDNCDLNFQDEVSSSCNHPTTHPIHPPTFPPSQPSTTSLPVGSVVVKGYDQFNNSFEVITLLDLPVNTMIQFTGLRYISRVMSHLIVIVVLINSSLYSHERSTITSSTAYQTIGMTL